MTLTEVPRESVVVVKKPMVDSSLGSRIRSRRKSIGMTQADLAAAIGVSFQQVQKYEKGISAISQSRLQQICDIMNLPPDFFNDESAGYIGKAVVGAEHNSLSKSEVMERFLATGEGRRLVESFSSITDQRLRTRILDFIAAIAADHRA